MNTIKQGDKTYKYEFFWRDDKNEKSYDSENKLLPFPVHQNENSWIDKNIFLKQLKKAQKIFTEKKKFKQLPTDQYKDCLLCDKKNIVTGTFTVNGMKWNTGMSHYINKHNVKPSNEFIDYRGV